MIKVLFVCLGNICRSPMAEAVFSWQVRQAGLDHKIECDSAGTGRWHLGEQPHMGTRHILDAKGIPWNHRAREITEGDLQLFDYIIPMDRTNELDILSLGFTKARVKLLMSFTPEAGVDEVPDPYYTGEFEEVYELVQKGAAGVLAEIREEHAL
jgi:protein-tyrosine phosphatase